MFLKVEPFVLSMQKLIHMYVLMNAMHRNEFLNLNLHQNNLVSTFRIVYVCSLYNYIGVPKMCFVLLYMEQIFYFP